MTTDGIFRVSPPRNEPVCPYVPEGANRRALDAEVACLSHAPLQIPCVVNGEHRFTGNTVEVRNPSAHAEVVAIVHLAGPQDVRDAIDGALAAKQAWMSMPWPERAAVFQRAATVLTGPMRHRVNAATLLGQGKTAHQAEIDAVCELVDFWRFNVAYAAQIYADQPPVSPPGVWNRLDHRPLDGFVFAVSPFNFTSIGLNLCTAPALMGNTVVWKPSLTASLASWLLYEMLMEVGLPPGVIQLVHGHGADVGDIALAHPDLGGVHFTGSTRTFQHMWRTIGENIASYRQYPRIVGETGGKDFIVAHPSADVPQLVTAIVRGGFEYQGQKCSAASRVYVPASLWPAVRDGVVAAMDAMSQGDPRQPAHFVGPVIDETAFDRIAAYVDLAQTDATVLAGGTYDKRVGWFVAPTFVQVADPKHRLMQEEVFGPLVTAYVYDDAAWRDTLSLVDDTSPYALTGAVFARDRAAITQALGVLRHAAGNVYINDKPTGAVVGQQPFGGGRASGTNDKAGSPLNLLRWVSPRTIKETYDAPRDWRYPFLGSK